MGGFDLAIVFGSIVSLAGRLGKSHAAKAKNKKEKETINKNFKALAEKNAELEARLDALTSKNKDSSEE